MRSQVLGEAIVFVDVAFPEYRSMGIGIPACDILADLEGMLL